MSERAEREVSNDEAVVDFLDTVLPAHPEEQQLIDESSDT
jgi:hypothetical protein